MCADLHTPREFANKVLHVLRMQQENYLMSQKPLLRQPCVLTKGRLPEEREQAQ